MSTVRKLTSTDGFVVVDYPDMAACGPLRVGRKILQSSASDLCRSATYTFASFEVECSGASAGVNAEGDDVASALVAAAGELGESAADQGLRLLPSKGVPAEATETLSALRGARPLEAVAEATVATVLAATSWALGGALSGRSFALEQTAASPAPDGLVDALVAAGMTQVVVDEAEAKPWMIWGAEADVVLCGSKPGVLTHQGVPFLKAGAVVPWGAIPVTTKALAALQRQDVVYVPDFISAAGGLLTTADPTRFAAVDALQTATVERLDVDRTDRSVEGLFLALASGAEEFLSSRLGSKPFGRPLAA